MLSTARLLVAALAAACAACRGGGGAADGAADAEGAAPPVYLHELDFVAARPGAPLVVPFSFRATLRGESVARAAHGWLARDSTWDSFLREEWSTGRAGGVWRVLPAGGLRVAAAGPTQLEWISYREGERSLRLDLGAPLSSWSAGREARFRVLGGRLTLGAESFSGAVLQALQVRRSGGPARGAAGDLFFLSGADSLWVLVVAPPPAAAAASGPQNGYAWTRTPQGEAWWDAAQVQVHASRPVQEARRDLPVQWSFSVAEASLRGEVRAVGTDTLLGPERGGRRALDVRFTVEGWVEREGRRSPVGGVVRYWRE